MTEELRLSSVDGYTIVDVAGTEWKVGPIRSAKKVLQRTTIDLGRHTTYTCATQRLDACGAAAALNFDRAGEGETPFAAFAKELDDWAEPNKFVGSIAMGLSREEAGPALQPTAEQAIEMVAYSAAACVPPDATSILIASDGDEPALRTALGEREVTVEADLAEALSQDIDVLFVRGKTGCLDHQALEATKAKTIVGLQPLTTTARGLAVAGRAGAVVIPDFISAGGPTLAALGLSPAEITSETSAAIARLTDAGIETFVNACELAEQHLATITEKLPFGRPLAP